MLRDNCSKLGIGVCDGAASGAFGLAAGSGFVAAAGLAVGSDFAAGAGGGTSSRFETATWSFDGSARLTSGGAVSFRTGAGSATGARPGAFGFAASSGFAMGSSLAAGSDFMAGAGLGDAAGLPFEVATTGLEGSKRLASGGSATFSAGAGGRTRGAARVADTGSGVGAATFAGVGLFVAVLGAAFGLDAASGGRATLSATAEGPRFAMLRLAKTTPVA